MGRIIAEKVKGINWKAKISLILIFTIMFSTFMYQGWYKPGSIQAATAAWQATGAYQSNTTALTVPWPAHQAGDVALLFVETANSAVTFTTQAGFTEVTNSPQSTGTLNTAGGTRLAVYWCRATSSAMTSPVLAAQTDHQMAVIMTFRGLTPTGNPFETSAGSVKAAASTTTTFPTVTTTTANDLIVLAAALDRDAASTANASAWTNANLGTITEQYDRTVTLGNGGGLAIATGAKATAGATNTSTVTVTSTISTQMTIALKPDIVAPTATVAVSSGTTVDVTFSEAMGSGVITASNYTVSGTGKGTLANNPDSVALVSGNQYRLTWNSGEMVNGGDITITVANAADLAGNAMSPNSGTSTGGGIGVAPTVTINQASGQADPTGTSPINFTVVFSETTTNFATGDVAITGTAGGTKTATVTGSGTTYNVAVTGMTTTGTVIASINAGAATDAAGNGNIASTSTDNTVTWAPNAAPTVTGFTAPATSTSKDIPVTITATDDSGTVAGYKITTSNTPPGAGDSGWQVTGSFNYTVSTDGSYTLYSWAKDAAGLVSAVFASQTVLVDTTPPTGLATNTPANLEVVNDLNIALTCTTATDALSSPVKYYFDVANSDIGFSQNSGWISGTSFSPPGLVAGNTYYWKVKAKDALGNETAYTSVISFDTYKPCTRNTPGFGSYNLSAQTLTVDQGVATYAVTFTNNDDGSCGNTSFTLTPTETLDEFDTFWSPALVLNTSDSGVPGDPINISLAPHASQLVYMKVKARSGEIAGRAKAIMTSSADANHSSKSTSVVTTTLNVSTCSANAPQLVIGPDAGNVAKGGSLAYSVSLKNTDMGTGCTATTYTMSIYSESPATPNANFNQSTLSYLPTYSGVQSVLISLNPGQTKTAVLTVSAPTGATVTTKNVTTIRVTATGHANPNDIAATTTVGNPILHNSINIDSTRWGTNGWGIPGGKYGEFKCDTCHKLESSTSTIGNIKKIRDSITTADPIPGNGQPITFTKVSGNPGDTGVLGDDSGLLTTSPRTSSNKICEICHTYDVNAQNGVRVHAYNSQAYSTDTDGSSTSSNHMNSNAKDCLFCHMHKIGFRPPICTSCHGVASTTAAGYASDHNTAAPGYMGTGVDTTGQTGTVTSNVSDNPRVGAHDVHLRGLNGLEAAANMVVCNDCHNVSSFSSPGHIDGTYTMTWSANATRGGMSPSFDGTSCANTYCHNPAGSGVLNSANTGTGTAPSWINGNYIADGTLKTETNCSVCHKSPWDAGFTSTFTHGTMTASTDCSGCHGHNGDATGSVGQRHMDGIKYGAGSCNTCHGYDASSWASATQRAVEGKGAHAKHITHLVTRWGGTLNPTGDQFGSGASWTNVCGVCHDGATHTTSEAIGGTGRTISILATYQFGPSAPLYSGVVGTSSSVNPKRCSNISCHFSTTMVWSSY